MRSRKDAVLKQDFRIYRKGKIQMKDQQNKIDNAEQEIVKKDKQGLEIPDCKNGALRKILCI